MHDISCFPGDCPSCLFARPFLHPELPLHALCKRRHSWSESNCVAGRMDRMEGF
jgi:hypothetical protein